MPSRVAALAAARDYGRVVAEYRRANATLLAAGARHGDDGGSKGGAQHGGGGGGKGGGGVHGGRGAGALWARLHAEVEARVADAWRRLEAELRRPDLAAADAPDLLLHALALRAEGLPDAQVCAVLVCVCLVCMGGTTTLPHLSVRLPFMVQTLLASRPPCVS